jgi:hypothetical protein
LNKERLRTIWLVPEFYQTFKEELTLMLLKIFHINERDGTLPLSSYEVKVPCYQGHNKNENILVYMICLVNIDPKIKVP